MNVGISPALQNYFMYQSLQISQWALPKCLPNPPVGCVLVKNCQVVARGYTQAPGSYHAEASALASYRGSLDDVSAFVTLEPCSFHGRTPACAKALIERRIHSVYVALTDPDPRNNGSGIKLLRDAGVDVIEGVLSDPVAEFLWPYLMDIRP